MSHTDPHVILLDLIAERDREWFAANRGERFRYRPMVPGDFGPATADLFAEARERGAEAMTEVEQLAPGIRRKAPYLVMPSGGPSKGVRG